MISSMVIPYIGFEWTATGWWIRPRTAREVMSIIGSIGVYNSGQRFAWRGMSSADYTLTSSLHRKVKGGEPEVRKVERRVLEEARSWGLGIQPTGHVDDLQLLSDLQHYGIATRLLDFTSNPMTALWFACQAPTPRRGWQPSKSGLLLALNVTKWDRLSTVGGPVPATLGEIDDPTGARLAQALAKGAPFIVESANPNDRLRAQEGFFVAGAVPEPVRVGAMTFLDPFKSISVGWKPGDERKLAERLTQERSVGAPRTMPFVAMIVNASLKGKLLRYLESTYNRSARVLFPDYGGFLEFGRDLFERDTSA
jgi:hypothetical protein